MSQAASLAPVIPRPSSGRSLIPHFFLVAIIAGAFGVALGAMFLALLHEPDPALLAQFRGPTSMSDDWLPLPGILVNHFSFCIPLIIVAKLGRAPRWFYNLGLILTAGSILMFCIPSLPAEKGVWWYVLNNLSFWPVYVWMLAALLCLFPPPHWGRLQKSIVISSFVVLYLFDIFHELTDRQLFEFPYSVQKALIVVGFPVGLLALVTTCWWALALLYQHRPAPGPRLAASVLVTCPHCAAQLPISPNAQTICSCGLRLRLEAHYARCGTCGYLLHGITSDRCPECGTVVPAGSLPTFTF